MKKLFLLLLTVCASVMAWAQNNTEAPRTLNPYAYDLASTWNANTQTLSISFKLNAVPNLNTTNVDKTITNIGTGIQVNAVDEQGNRYRICAPSTGEIRAAHKATGGHGGSYSYDIQFVNGKSNKTNVTIPTDRLLTWEVRVNGVPSTAGRVYNGFSNTAYYNHSLPIFWSTANNPIFDKRFVSHSVDICTNPQSPNFGRIFITDGIKVSTDTGWGDAHSNYYYSYTEGRGVYILEPDYITHSNGGKRVALNSNKNGGFVDPLEPREVCVSDNGRIFICSASKTSDVAVWELSSNYKEWTQILTKTKLGSRRVVAMDIKGINDAITLLLLCAPKNGNTPLSCYEYNLLTNELSSVSLHSNVTNYISYVEGINFQAKIQYAGNGDIWVGLGNENGSRVVRVKDDFVRNYGSSYGGEAFLIQDNLMIKSYRTANHTDVNYYRVDNGSNYYSSHTTDDGINVGSWITDFAIDYANNLFVANNYRGAIVPISLPYDGVRTTPAPSGQTFTLDKPVPNILATDLKCTPHEKYARYIFSFNVNTKPEGAEIRFYNTEAEMLADCNQNETYSRYDDHEKCSYYYRFSELKQGRMSVEMDILGHEGGKELADKKLPAGELYWNVFLKTRKSNAFAPMYLQPNTGEHLHYRIASTIDNNPDNDGFGHIYAIDTKRVDWTTSAMKDNPCALMVYTIGDANIDDSNSNGVNSATRYSLVQKLSADTMVQPRRPAVAPDGMVYLTDYGDYRYKDVDFNSTGKGPNEFVLGGILLFNPNDPYKDAGKTVAKLSRFHPENETVSDACFYHDGTNLKLYKTNTYDEYDHHAVGEVDKNYQDAHWTNNGYRVYTMRYNQDGSIIHQMALDEGILVPFKVKDKNGDWVGGDANGSLSVRATSDGVWFCQNRKGDASTAIKPDNIESVALMFYNHDKERKFQSYTYDGGSLTQYTTSLLQSTPGGGMTISPDEKYLYVVNHEGNILEFEIGGSAITGKTLTYRNKYINTTTYKCIVTLDFDYAGNLVATTDESYPAYLNEGTQIVVFTMPYNRDNARTIPASKSERLVPERLSQDLNNDETIKNVNLIGKSFALDLYRPLQGATYNTICLPFDLDLSKLTTPHKLYGAKAMAFTGVSSPTVGGEEVLCLNFTSVTQLQAGKPYIIYVENHVRGLIEFAQITMSNTAPYTINPSSSVTYTGVYNPTPIGEGNTILVDQNRLANVTNEGTLSGFRGYFTIPESLRSLKAMISTKRDTPTGLEDLNITERTYQKFLREGRVYIRMGESLYTVDGQLVK